MHKNKIQKDRISNKNKDESKMKIKIRMEVK